MIRISQLMLLSCILFISSCVSKPVDSQMTNQANAYEQCLIQYSRDVAAVRCEGLFNKSTEIKTELPRTKKITVPEIETFTKNQILNTLEFKFVRAEAEKLGMRVWMFGGTASSYLHYTKWDLLRQKGLSNLQADRFNYSFTNIFRSTQDLDIVADGSLDQIAQLQNILEKKFKYLTGSKSSWEVRSLKHSMGSPDGRFYKEALLNDPNFSNQNTDTNSLAMVEITNSDKFKEPTIRDLRAWTTGQSQFIEDAITNTISYLRNPLHKTTARYKMGENPEIFSVLRLLVKAFQYDLSINPKSMNDIKLVISEFNPKDITNAKALRRLNDIAVKLVMHSNNIENAMNTLDQLGLRQKLVSMNLKGDGTNDTSFWLQKEPLRSFEIPNSQWTGNSNKYITDVNRKIPVQPNYQSGKLKNKNLKATGKTAKDLGVDIVAHDVNNMQAYESIKRSHSGEPNILISREKFSGEAAIHGDGFYTRIGKEGARDTGITIRFKIDPAAREGIDFTKHDDYIIILNKKALRVIQESINIGIADLVAMLEDGSFKIASGDKGIYEMMKRELNGDRIAYELSELLKSKDDKDLEKFQKLFKSIINNKDIKEILGTEIIQELITNTKDMYLENVNSVGKKSQVLDQIINIFLSKADFTEKTSFFEELTHKASNERIEELTKNIQKELNQIQTVLNMKKDSVTLEEIRLKNGLELNLGLIVLAENKVNLKDIKNFFEVDKVLAEINKRNESKEEKNRLKELVTRIIDPDKYYTIGNFFKIKPGQFKMGLKGSQKTKVIDKEFELAQTQMTQLQYARLQVLVGETEIHKITPSHFNDKAASIRIEINGYKLLMQPDHPVEKVSHNQITALLRKINELSIQGDAKIQAELNRILPGHKQGHVYDLPTSEQWEYVMRNRGKANGEWFDKDIYDELDKYSWNGNNSGNETHAVGTKNPRMVDVDGSGTGLPFYDLEGNVLEWTSSKGSNYRILRGGGWHSYSPRTGYIDRNLRTARYSNIGVRLIRTSSP